jgi:hypothetical protein
MWEWLRRDPDYIAWHAGASATTRACGTPSRWGLHFRRRPRCPGPLARVIWHAVLDPGTLRVAAIPATCKDPDAILLDELAPWLALATDLSGREHAVLSDGKHRIRLDVEEGHLSGEIAVRLRYHLEGLASAERMMLPLRRFLDLCRHRRFTSSLFPRDPLVSRGIEVLRVHDALARQVSQREIGEAVFGGEKVARDWNGRSDYLRSRIRRLVREARAMAAGGYRSLLRRH